MLILNCLLSPWKYESQAAGSSETKGYKCQSGCLDGDNMATKSFLKNISIKNKNDSRNFVKALEKAETKPNKKVTLSKAVVQVNGNEIKKYLGLK